LGDPVNLFDSLGLRVKDVILGGMIGGGWVGMVVGGYMGLDAGVAEAAELGAFFGTLGIAEGAFAGAAAGFPLGAVAGLWGVLFGSAINYGLEQGLTYMYGTQTTLGTWIYDWWNDETTRSLGPCIESESK
jgi:hypothetical protein